ncbi:SPOC domain [Dorcoceras hygrometricum]|uniref:SPOC domain n=1 Tax=Dorcoceras hygrometricum TaxID=472368 RepID=A0A2Z7D941_9LAMI|nr:SPOC domain [Dorcoceras hygrometricum]
MGHSERSVVEISTPENVAVEIESELFKLYGGVNKKYKEKGRSLLFNLKDRNNPELRERVMSGDISPEKLCSMSAEELASKELSEWRMAKAEEMAQMVVLPDTEVDIRRLVKKTHKGEYQLEIERDDEISAEVSGGTTVLTQLHPQKKIETSSPSVASPKDKENIAGQKSSENQDFSGSLIIPTDGTDLLQGMMVDELKDAEFLPPIVSLDEFMESLNAEPPFGNLSPETADKTLVTRKESPKVVINSPAPDHTSVSSKDASPKNSDVLKKLEGKNEKSNGNLAKQKRLPIHASSVNYIWEGKLQLNTLTSVNVGGIFQSGEKTSTKEWPTSLEIKGRVRFDSFEKFLRELPMSRTRAVMVLQFVFEDKSSETPHSSLSEFFMKAIESFAADERLGYAEPSPGVELYLCPPTSRVTNMINEHMPKQQSETDNTIENGLLIGVVVWRRAHKSNIVSPNNSSYNKHSLKKQSLDPSKKMQDSSNVKANVNAQTRAFTSGATNVVRSTLTSQTDEDDDIPPGFGPMSSAGAAKDDDDLPEFNFSGPLNPSIGRVSPQNLHNRGLNSAHSSVDQVRELIKKYGHSGGSATTSRSLVDDRVLAIRPWNDEEDDIPEWQPQLPNQLHGQPFQSHRQPLQLPLSSQHMVDMLSRQPPRGWEGPPSSGGWVTHQLPPGPQRDGRWKRY